MAVKHITTLLAPINLSGTPAAYMFYSLQMLAWLTYTAHYAELPRNELHAEDIAFNFQSHHSSILYYLPLGSPCTLALATLSRILGLPDEPFRRSWYNSSLCALTTAPRFTSRSTMFRRPRAIAACSAFPYHPPWALTSVPLSRSRLTISS